MRILVTGASGQLGLSLKKVQPVNLDAVYAAHAQLNLSDPGQVSDYLDTVSPECIINCAAYTKVDQAEKEPEAANDANNVGVKNLAEVCRRKNIFLIHISTDFLFHGAFNRPIDESKEIMPLGVYALSKAAGEAAFFASRCRGAIVRTSWLYSEFGANFMKTMLRLGREKNELKVIADQHGSPTYAVDLARGLWRLAAQATSTPSSAEIYHFSNYGVTTWYDFAKAILDLAGITTPVLPILTHEYPVPTPRPAYSALWPRKFSESFNFQIRNWRDALAEAISEGENK